MEFVFNQTSKMHYSRRKHPQQDWEQLGQLKKEIEETSQPVFGAPLSTGPVGAILLLRLPREIISDINEAHDNGLLTTMRSTQFKIKYFNFVGTCTIREPYSPNLDPNNMMFNVDLCCNSVITRYFNQCTIKGVLAAAEFIASWYELKSNKKIKMEP